MRNVTPRMKGFKCRCGCTACRNIQYLIYSCNKCDRDYSYDMDKKKFEMVKRYGDNGYGE